LTSGKAHQAGAEEVQAGQHDGLLELEVASTALR